MSQPIFKDPIVTAGPTLTGVGNGTVTIDRLTHFTIEQDYTLTCIAKTPDTLFAVTGSLDGPVGIAVVGSQFYDEDLKVFFTIQQGATPFEIGDIFEFSVTNGTDLHQDNIDDYDELPQKNFGEGTKGTMEGDHNLRYLDSDVAAYRYVQDLKYTSVAAGNAGNSIQIEYLAPVPAVAAELIKQDLTFTATPGAAGNLVSIEYFQYTPQAKASETIQNISYVADNFGAAGNLISIEYIGGGTAGSELVSVLSNAITVEIEDGVSTADQIKLAVDAFPAAAALVDLTITGLGTTPQTIQGPTFLLGGLDAFGEAGDEEVSITGTDIQVTLESGVSTATQVKSAIEAHPSFGPLGVTITISGVASNPQTSPDAQEYLTGGADSYGYAGDETVDVIGNLIKIFFESGKSTATQIKAAFDAFPAATALATATIIGFASHAQVGPMSAKNLIGGKNKFYSFNHEELTDSLAFVEGNAGLKIQDARLLGQLEVDGHANFKGQVSLDDQNTENIPGERVGHAQRTINELIQDQKITLHSANDDAVIAWAAPTMTFADNILITFNDAAIVNTILAAESPVTLADGESAYVNLSRYEAKDLEIFVAATVPKNIDALRIATRLGDNLRLWDNTLIRNNSSAAIGEGGGGGAVTKVDLFDPISTTLPVGPSAIVDGVTLANDDLVLYTNLTVGNNQVYSVSGVGVSLVFTPVNAFSSGITPTHGDLVVIKQGTGFQNQLAEFNGTNFQVNPYTRHFNGVDYWELSSLQTADILNNTTAEVFRVAYAGSENMIVDFSILRGTATEVGTIHITTDGTNVSRSITGVYLGSSGVDLQASIDMTDLVLEYVSDNSGSSGTLKYFVRRWSNTAGGPAGLPSYSSGGGGSVSAAGSAGDIQFNSGGLLGADSDFKWDSTNNILTKAGLQSSGINGPVLLLDNQGSFTAAFSYDAATYPFAIIEYSLSRDDKRETGRILISNNGIDVGFSVDSVCTDIGGSGITFDAVISGPNVEVQYMSTSTGFNANLKYSFRRWS
jgi:hypothetical protein